VLVTPTVVARSLGSPVVAVDPHTGGEDVPTVDSDNRHGADMATEHLLQLGHRRIGFVSGRDDLESARLRELGFRDALARHGVELDPALVRCGQYEEAAATDAAHQLLELPEPPTAVFAANDSSAIATMAVARSRGLSVPDQLSVIGFDDIPEGVMVEPALTTIHQPIQEMGERAIELLVQLLAGETPPVTHVTLRTHLVRRQSCAIAPADRVRAAG
jgi:LacI family transcriptional regulator